MKLNLMIKRAILIFIIALFCTGVIMLFRINENIKNKDNSTREMVANTDFRSMAQRESQYTIIMYDILRPVTRGGFSTYGYKKCLSDAEKIRYTALNFKLALAFKYGLYEVPAEHILESNFNPYKVHDIYGELGLGGFWYSTAVFYHDYAERYMPRNLWSYVSFKLSRPEHLLNYENALKMSYIWKWVEGHTYINAEMWLASSRRWGKFIYKHYNNGADLFPIKFTIKLSSGEVKKYNPRKIYYVWRNLCRYFEAGNIAAAHDLFIDYRHDKVKIEKAEIRYRTLKGRIRQLEKQIDNYKKITLLQSSELENLKSSVDKAKKVCKQIGGEAKEIGWTDKLKKRLKKAAAHLYSQLNEKEGEDR